MIKLKKNNNINMIRLICGSLVSVVLSINSIYASDPIKEQAEGINNYYNALRESRGQGGKTTVEQENRLREQHVYPAEENYYKAYSKSYYEGMAEANLEYVPESKMNKEMALWGDLLDINKKDDSSSEGGQIRKLSSEQGKESSYKASSGSSSTSSKRASSSRSKKSSRKSFSATQNIRAEASSEPSEVISFPALDSAPSNEE